MEFTPVIGLEVHAQLLTHSKAFCACPTDYGAPPNSHVCPICLGMPGVLPVLNRRMVDMALLLALALGCRIRTVLQFARKNYFYPDLPKGYQISQYDQPLAEHGFLEFDLGDESRRVGIHRVHLEEDAGKSFHLDGGHSLVDFNRCGVPLVEIVSEPDITSPEEARGYLSEIHRVVEYLGVCTGNMEEGALRCDANVSLSDPDTGALGTRTEVKNMNSFRGVQRALEFEIERQAGVLRSGGKIQRQTLLWDEAAGVARPMRRKELAHDYRYFPEPDLVLLEVDDVRLSDARSRLPELPRAAERRLMADFGLNRQQAQILISDPVLVKTYQAVVAAGGSKRTSATFMVDILLPVLREAGRDPVGYAAEADPRFLAGPIRLMDEGILTKATARTVFYEMVETGSEASTVVQRRGISKLCDQEALLLLIHQVLEENPTEVQRYLEGRTKLFGFFMGQLMSMTGGQGDPVKLRELLGKKLEELRKTIPDAD
jgi:aspartyl-tRNA(Asn)/glutamyl-tRNA(Gln) amidotransferase subunit B